MNESKVTTQEQQAAISLRKQTSSPLLRLPGELRNRIYEYAFSGHIIHTGAGLEPKPLLYLAHDWSHRPLSLLTNLPQICRQIHAETALMIFTHSEFMLTLSAIPHFLSTIQPQQRDAIKRIRTGLLEFRYFREESMISGLAAFAGLEHVTIKLLRRRHEIAEIDAYWLELWQKQIREAVEKSVGEGVEILFE